MSYNLVQIEIKACLQRPGLAILSWYFSLYMCINMQLLPFEFMHFFDMLDFCIRCIRNTNMLNSNLCITVLSKIKESSAVT